MDWKEFIKALFMEVNIVVDDSRKVIVYAPEFLVNLTAILNETMKTEEGIM